jgi:O-antigen/teichoic acid export membrane protein
MTVMSVRSAAAWAIASQYTSFAIQFISSIVLARWFISPTDLGLFTIAFAAVSLISFLQDFGIARYINGERDLTEAKIRTAYTVSTIFAFGIAFASILTAWPIAWFYGDPALLPVTLVVASSYLMIPFAVVPQALCQRQLDYRSNTMIEVGSAIANSAVAVFFAMRGYGALALAGGAFAQQFARMAVAQWRAGGKLPWPLSLEGVAPMLAIGKTATISSICWQVVSRAPELEIGRVFSHASVGLFSRASGLALQLRLLVSGAVTGVFYPAFRAVRDRGEPLGPPYLRVVAAITGITWPAMAGIAVLAWPLVDLLYGPRWVETAPLLTWVALAQLCYVALPLNGDLPILLERMRRMVRLQIGETLLCIVLVIAAARIGLEAVAIAIFIHGLASVAIYAPLMHEMLGFRWRDLWAVWGKSALVTLAAVTPALASYALWQEPQQAGAAQVCSGALAGIAAWLVTLKLVRHSLYDEIGAMLGDLLGPLRLRLTALSGK